MISAGSPTTSSRVSAEVSSSTSNLAEAKPARSRTAGSRSSAVITTTSPFIGVPVAGTALRSSLERTAGVEGRTRQLRLQGLTADHDLYAPARRRDLHGEVRKADPHAQ